MKNPVSQMKYIPYTTSKTFSVYLYFLSFLLHLKRSTNQPVIRNVLSYSLAIFTLYNTFDIENSNKIKRIWRHRFYSMDKTRFHPAKNVIKRNIHRYSCIRNTRRKVYHLGFKTYKNWRQKTTKLFKKNPKYMHWIT